ncbi:hypothetical protein H5410_021817 [Solanum commersonii]|uniref:Uncharacterized protein n=1 Tax=Solanum commersonii TaxID=4109 RepID=A0A9J5ZFC9_SOLCO|nr:hypothetical protein H5410_021817 [Solanum commersonii]
MFFSSKEKLKRAVTIWSLHKNKEFKVVTSTKSLWVVRCKFYSLLGCLWFLRGRKVGDNLWKIGKYVENHRCETEGLSSGHANLNTSLIASLFLNQIRKNPKYLVVDVTSKVHEKFGHQVTYRKAWLGRQRAFELVYGDFEKSFSDLPKFFIAFQYFNHGTVVEWKHEESMSSSEELRRFQEPRAFHRFCIRHLKSNFQSKFPNKDLSRLMWRAASAHQVRKFESLMWQIREENVEAHEYLMEIPLDKWTISHDGGKRWGVLTTNLSESFNGVLKKARGLPVTAMVRLSLEQTIERYTRRSQIAHQLAEQNELWTGRFKTKWEKNFESSKRHFVFDWNIPTGVYEVADRMGGLARNFVSEHFTIENYVATYSGSFSPIGHEAYWPSPSFTIRSNEFYRRPNRPRTTRIPNEMDCGSTVYERACGLCRQTGHDRRRCPNRK